MIPVTLSKLDNYPGFVGSFDLINWWKTEPLSGSIEFINDVTWTYGQYHVCSAKMLDGTYSIYQSKDNGYSWKSVLNISEVINTIYCPDYGVALAATSDGWWRSLNSGTSWTKISTSAPGCFCVKKLNNEIIIALSTNKVWRSTNQGTTWTTILTPATNIIYPALDGTTSDLLLGIGNELYYSDNAGSTWINISNRMRAVFPSPGTSYIGTITDIELTAIDNTYINPGGTVYDTMPSYIIQFKLQSGMLRHYRILRTPSADEIVESYYMFNGSAKFDALSSVKNSLNATYSKHTGTEATDKLVVFTGTNAASGKPMVKYSTDSGIIWSTIDLSTASLYDGPDLSQISYGSNPLTEDVYFTASWSHGVYCHNYYTITSNYYTMNQSYDMDFLLYNKIPHDETYSMDILNQKMFTKQCHFDFLSKKTRNRGKEFDVLIRNIEMYTYTMDVLNQKMRTNGVSLDVLNKKMEEETATFDILNRDTHLVPLGMFTTIFKTVDTGKLFDIISVLRFYKTAVMDALILKTVNKPLIADILYKDTNEHTYGMDIHIDETIVYDILHNSERYSPQFPAIGLNYKKRPYPIFDSRNEVKE
jgi:hypothetical protein